MFKNKKSTDFFYLDEDSQILSLTKYCEWRNCEEKGEFKAPTSRDKLRVFKWFCLKHIKIYNKGWDYFKGRTSDQIYKEVSDDATWHRPTWVKVKNNKFTDPHNLFNFNKNISNDEKVKFLTDNESADVVKYLKVLEMEVPKSLSDLKKKYKIMVKKFHPDVSKIKNDENIVKLNEAYSNLLKLLKF